MYDADHVASIDIETLNDEGQGLDPTHPRSRITEISLTSAKGTIVLADADERDLLEAFNDALWNLPANCLLSGWNSSMFDLPFIGTRAKTVGAHHLLKSMFLVPMPGLKPKYSFTPGHTTGYTAYFETPRGTHAHLDIAFAYKAYAESFGLSEPDYNGKCKPLVPWSLKPVCDALGIEMYVLDRTRLHEYTPEERARYAGSDTKGTRELTLRALGLTA